MAHDETDGKKAPIASATREAKLRLEPRRLRLNGASTVAQAPANPPRRDEEPSGDDLGGVPWLNEAWRTDG